MDRSGPFRLTDREGGSLWRPSAESFAVVTANVPALRAQGVRREVHAEGEMTATPSPSSTPGPSLAGRSTAPTLQAASPSSAVLCGQPLADPVLWPTAHDR